jgi:anti-sigma B factor antagonist
MAGQNRFQMPQKIDAGSAAQLQEKIFQEIGKGDAGLLLDFENTNYISSAGLRVILTVHKKMRAEGRDLELCNVKQQILEVFELTGFSCMLVIN